MVLLYYIYYGIYIEVPKRLRDSVSGDVFISQTRGGITGCDYPQSSAALSHEKCSPGPNSISYGLKFYRSVRDTIAHLVFERISYPLL